MQNGPWPCGACVRLRLKCIPPSRDPDGEQQTPESTGDQQQYSFHNKTVNGFEPKQEPDWNESSAHHAFIDTRQGISPSTFAAIPPYVSQYQSPAARSGPGYTAEQNLTSATRPSLYQHAEHIQDMPSLVRTKTEASESDDPHEVDATVKELSEHMGDLCIDQTSIASYIANEKKLLAEIPAMEEVELSLPPSVNHDSTVTIPPEMMPSEERAMDYFGYYFSHIHPYVPVLNRSVFYEQWRSARRSISPLILEGIFACVARYLEEPIEVRRWLALASKHEESFKDVPRFSTIQGQVDGPREIRSGSHANSSYSELLFADRQ